MLDFTRVTVRLGKVEAKGLGEMAKETDRPVSYLIRSLIKQAVMQSKGAERPHASAH